MSVPMTRLVTAVFLFSVAACGGDRGAMPANHTPGGSGIVLHSFPARIDPQQRYLIYLHNRFLETAAPGEKHPAFGAYEYGAILEQLAVDGVTVIGERRPEGADVREHALVVAEQVQSLIVAGVPPSRITVVGFSKGGAIAILASSEAARDDVNFVFIAACGPWLRSATEVQAYGRLLSIRELSDDLAGSCDLLFERATRGTATREIELRLGGGHGAFFRPQPDWIVPLTEWSLGSSD